jgi:16S rRNA processing protein RimM
VAAPARLVVGRVLRPHGVRGEVSVEILSDAAERFSPGAKLAAGDPDQPSTLRELQVEASRLHQGRMLLRFAGVGDRDAVEPLRGQWLSIPLEDARDLAPDEYWPHQLVGLRVVDSDGRERGVVADVLPGAANDLLAVRRGDGRQALVPAVAALVTVELEAGRVLVRALPGLFEEED